MVKAFILCTVGTGEYLGLMKTTKEKIEKMPGVVKAHNIFGRYDVIAEVEVRDLEELSRLVADVIRIIPGVLSTETFICYPT
jgi:DNA-binding Lrp family transcriptional regulator